jgi:YD repeat-containing protein
MKPSLQKSGLPNRRHSPLPSSVIRHCLAFVIAIASLGFFASAGVNLKNGNFHITYTDIIVGSGKNRIEISRTYNSKSVEVGMFGFGWGSEFETRLVPSQDGSIVVHEHGGGGKTSFDRDGYTDADFELLLTSFVGALLETPLIASPSAREELFQKMKQNREFARSAYLELAAVVGAPADHVFGGKGAVFASSQRGLQTIVRDDNGFTRISAGGASERFDSNGYLVFVFDGAKAIRIVRDNAGRITRLTSGAEGETLVFTYNDQGFVTRIENPETQSRADYRYLGDDLVWSRDTRGNVYAYGYDASHNLQSITYDDATTMDIAYHPSTMYVARVTERDGEETAYDYYETPPDALATIRSFAGHPVVDRYGTRVTKRGYDGEPLTNSYDYDIAVTSLGERYTSRIATNVNGIVTETLYNAASLPVSIARGSWITTFRYNQRNLLIERSSTRGDFVRTSYYDGIDKIRRVENNDGVFEYEYDAGGNLTTARHAGRTLLLTYDVRGRITKITDRSATEPPRALAYIHNAQGKPARIELADVGHVDILYDDYGEIQSVASPAGQATKLRVEQTRESIWRIVKPAGVDLNM